MAVFPWLISLALLLTAFTAQGAEALKAELIPLTLFPRSGAPALFDLRLKHAGASVIEGRVEITFKQNGVEMLRWTSHELALAGGAQTVRVLTPPPTFGMHGGSTEASLRFLTARGSLPLGSSLLGGDGARVDRRAIIAVGALRERVAPADGTTPTWQDFRFDSVEARAGWSGDETVATTPVFLDPEDFPVDPLAYCAFDIVVLDDRIVEMLRPRSRTALVRWIEGGGNVALVSRSVDAAERRELLDRFLVEGQGAKPVAAAPSTERGDLFLGYAGLGRCAVLTADGSGDARAEQRSIARDFLWSIPAKTERDRTSANRRARSQQRVATPVDQRLFTSLMPQSVRLIPPWQIFGILTLLIVVIGPLDWLLLGRLRARKFTWLLLPCAVAGATVATVALAGRALGWATHRAAVVVKDLGPDGRVLRQNRFELTLVPREATICDTITGALVAPLPAAGDPSGLDSGRPWWATDVRGQFPARYEMERSLRQWSPSLVRTMSFGGEDDSGLAWDDLRLREPGAWRQRVRGWTSALLAPPPGWEIERVNDRTAGQPLTGDLFAAPGLSSAHGSMPGGPLRPTVAPRGSAACDDLAMSDSADARQWFVIAVRRVGRDIHIYRRLFFE